MGESELKNKAKKIVSARSVKPDMLYMLYIALFGITVVFIPFAYCIMEEYRRYLRHCLKLHDDTLASSTTNSSKQTYKYPHPLSTHFSYSLRVFKRAAKAFACLLLPGCIGFNMPHLDEKRNWQVKMGLANMKIYFPHMFASTAVAAALIVISILSAVDGMYIKMLIYVVALAVFVLIMIKPMAVYFQAYIIYEKSCLEMTVVEEDAEDEEFFI